MTTDSMLKTSKAVVFIVLLAIDFVVFSQTALGGYYVNDLSHTIVVNLPFLAGINQVMPFLLFGLFTALVSLFFFMIEKKRITFLSIISFLLFLPAALSAPSVNWSSANAGASNISNVFSFIITVMSGIVIVACLVILSYVMKLSATRIELLARGGNNAEVDTVIGGSFSFALGVTVASVVLSVVAVVLFVAGQPIGGLLAASTSTFVPFVLGIGAVVTIAVLMYYYLKRKF
jgi:hypothetical protein